MKNDHHSKFSNLSNWKAARLLSKCFTLHLSNEWAPCLNIIIIIITIFVVVVVVVVIIIQVLIKFVFII